MLLKCSADSQKIPWGSGFFFKKTKD